MLRRTASGVVLALAVAGLAAASASATTPGRNGRIAYTKTVGGNLDVWTVLSDTASEARLTTDPASDQGPSWSPDGTKILFSSQRTGSGDIYVMNADGTNQTLLMGGSSADAKPQWSPDGTKIAFTRRVAATPSGTVLQVWVANADGSNPAVLTPDNTRNHDASGENWSPDGTHLVYTYEAGNATKGIWTMSADGSGQTRIYAGTSNYYGPSYSPDGTKIVCYCGATEDIATMNTDGSNFTQLTTDSNSYGPAWSPDGTKITWVDFSDVWVMNSDGSNKTQVTTDAPSPGGLTWQTLPNAPSATTGAVTGVTTSSATIAGTVNPATRVYGTTYHFEYGTTAAYGSSTADQSLTGDTSDHAVSAALASLAAGTTYHVRLVATNGAGTTNGLDQTFTTTAAPAAPDPPAVATPPAITPPVITTPSITGLTAGVRCARRVRVGDPVAGRTGQWFKYSLSEAASVSYRLEREMGSRAFRRCPSGSSATASRFRRVWFTTLAQDAGRQAITIGSVRFHVTSRARTASAASIAKLSLSPGLYRVVLVATNEAGRSSAPAYAYFRVLRASSPRRH